MTPDLTVTVTLSRTYYGWRLKATRNDPASSRQVALLDELNLTPKRAVGIAAAIDPAIAEVVRERFAQDADRLEAGLAEAEERHDREARTRRESIQKQAVEAREARDVASRWPVEGRRAVS